MSKAELLINFFDLQQHPEGGWYRQTYRADEKIRKEALPVRFSGDRFFSTAIYFLLEKGNFSAFHKIKSDECWHFYDGDPLEIYIFEPGGNLRTVVLGKEFSQGQSFQYVVTAGCWFASRPASGSEYCFTGCTVAPGFDFEDFELADANGLSTQFPAHKEIIRELCR